MPENLSLSEESRQYFMFDIPEASRNGYVVDLHALNGMTFEVDSIQKDHWGYTQFVGIKIDTIVEAYSEAEMGSHARAWSEFQERRLNNSVNYVPEQEAKRIVVTVGMGKLFESLINTEHIE